MKSAFISTSWIMVRGMKGCSATLLWRMLSVARSFVFRAVSPILPGLKSLEIETLLSCQDTKLKEL